MTVSGVFFDRGHEFVAHAHLPSEMITDPDEGLRAEWYEFCQDTGLATPNHAGHRWVPRLASFRRDRHFEIYDVELPGLLGVPARVAMLSEMLLSCRHAASEATTEIQPGVVRVVLNFMELPEELAFDPARIPDSPDEVYLGQTGLGGDLVWDTRSKAHGLIIGENGGGKSDTMATLLMQLHWKGWEITVLTPTTDDTTFQPFADLGHTVIAGSEPEDIAAMAAVVAEQTAQLSQRERIRAAAGTDWYEGPPSILLVDESGDVLADRKWDDPKTRENKGVCRAGVDLRARRGRKTRQHSLLGTQEGYVHSFGTPETLRQLKFRLAVTGLSDTFQPTIFERSGDQVSPAVRRVLSNPSTPKGRGVARGVRPSGDEAYAALDDLTVQVAYCPSVERERLLGTTRPTRARSLEVVA